MKNEEPKFTKEELFYIEKIMDINATHGIKILEVLSKIRSANNDSKVEKELVDCAEKELSEAQKVTKSIRNKIESWRRE